MARYCAYCGKQLEDNAAVCPACGKQVAPSAAAGAVAAPAPSATGLADNVAGMLAYVTIIPAIIFLLLEPYSHNRFIRFHAFQSVFLCIAWIVVGVGVQVISHIPFLGWFVGSLLSLVICFGAFILWLLCLIKAYQGQMWKVPIVGDFAERQANA